MNSPLPFEADPCIPADLAPREEDREIRRMKEWTSAVFASIHPSAGITTDPNSLRGKTLVLDGHPIPFKAI